MAGTSLEVLHFFTNGLPVSPLSVRCARDRWYGQGQFQCATVPMVQAGIDDQDLGSGILTIQVAVRSIDTASRQVQDEKAKFSGADHKTCLREMWNGR